MCPIVGFLAHGPTTTTTTTMVHQLEKRIHFWVRTYDTLACGQKQYSPSKGEKNLYFRYGISLRKFERIEDSISLRSSRRNFLRRDFLPAVSIPNPGATKFFGILKEGREIRDLESYDLSFFWRLYPWSSCPMHARIPE